MGGQIAWLLPAAVVLLVAALWVDRTDPALLLWGGWLVVTALVFSHMNGIIHGYYTVALAPAVAAVVAIGAASLWRRRSDPVAAAVLAGAVALTAVEAYLLTPWLWLRIVVLVAGLAGAVGLVVTADLPDRRGVAVVAVIAVLAGPAAYSVATAATPHTGAIPTAGPRLGPVGGPRLTFRGVPVMALGGFKRHRPVADARAVPGVRPKWTGALLRR